MGTAAASAGAAGPSEGLRAGRSSGRTKPGVHRAERTTRPCDYGSGPTRQSDDRDSEPDYLLRPTMHGPGGTLLIIAHFGLERRSLNILLGRRAFKGDRCNVIFSASRRYFGSALNTDSSFGC